VVVVLAISVGSLQNFLLCLGRLLDDLLSHPWRLERQVWIPVDLDQFEYRYFHQNQIERILKLHRNFYLEQLGRHHQQQQEHSLRGVLDGHFEVLALEVESSSIDLLQQLRRIYRWLVFVLERAMREHLAQTYRVVNLLFLLLFHHNSQQQINLVTAHKLHRLVHLYISVLANQEIRS
jgi:hypothetical protein